MKFRFLVIATFLGVAACTHKADVTVYDVSQSSALASPDRHKVAMETCDAVASDGLGEYLSAIQNLMGTASQSAADGAALDAPLDAFRDEVNVAYRNVVMRCKTHMQCLEVNAYNEARCYMAAADRKDAERSFSDLSYQLRDLEREIKLAEIDAKKRAATKPPKVTVETNVTQSVEQEQRVGDDVEDQDVLVACGMKRLLARDCRRQCSGGGDC